MPRLLLDANLLVLFVVGNVDPQEIERHKRLNAYRVEDYELLVGIVGRFEQLATLPNILTEASNLLRQCPPHKQPAFAGSLARFAIAAVETYQESAEAVLHPAYVRLGVTDASVLRALRSGDRLLTADLDLYLAAARAGLQAENFNHLREASLDP